MSHPQHQEKSTCLVILWSGGVSHTFPSITEKLFILFLFTCSRDSGISLGVIERLQHKQKFITRRGDRAKQAPYTTGLWLCKSRVNYWKLYLK